MKIYGDRMEFNAQLAGARESFDNAGNRGWWEKNPMLYDWNKVHGVPALDSEYFEKIDRIFGEGHRGAIMQMEGERLALRDSSFDFVVSWGVIHHSGDMAAIIREIHRVLRPGGRAYIMVYNRKSLRYQVYCRFWLGVVRMKLLKKRLEEVARSQ